MLSWLIAYALLIFMGLAAIFLAWYLLRLIRLGRQARGILKKLEKMAGEEKE